MWELLNKDKLNHARHGEWGLYCNDILEMGDILHLSEKYEQALRNYLEVCYLDLNDPNNVGPSVSPSLIKEFPPFSKAPKGLAPGVISLIVSVCGKATIPRERVEQIFFEHAAKMQSGLKLPMKPEEAWPIIRGAFDEAEAGK